jgi:hypothetical protein
MRSRVRTNSSMALLIHAHLHVRARKGGMRGRRQTSSSVHREEMDGLRTRATCAEDYSTDNRFAALMTTPCAASHRQWCWIISDYGTNGWVEGRVIRLFSGGSFCTCDDAGGTTGSITVARSGAMPTIMVPVRVASTVSVTEPISRMAVSPRAIISLYKTGPQGIC